MGRKHRYAYQRLHELNKSGTNKYQLYSGRKKILRFKENSYYNLEVPEPKVEKGIEFDTITRIREINSYEEVKKRNFLIVSVRVKGRQWFKGQQVKYMLIREGENIEDVLVQQNIPRFQKVQVNMRKGLIRIIGKNTGKLGVGPWLKIELEKQKQHKEIIKKLTFTDYYKNSKDIIDYNLGISKKIQEYVKIKNEIPCMISETNELVCLPNTRDEIVAGCVGRRGSGKTMMLNSISGRAYWYVNKRIFFANDSLNQFSSLCLPNKSFNTQELTILDEHPMPLPIILLYPTTKDMSEKLMFEDEKISFKISFPSQDLFMDWSKFAKAKKDWDLGKSIILLRLIRDDIISAVKDALRRDKDIFKTLLKVVSEAENNKEYIESLAGYSKASKTKIVQVLEDIFNEKILDINTNIPSKWTIYDIVNKTFLDNYYLPHMALLYVGLVPVLMTNNLISKDYHAMYMKLILDNLFITQTQDIYFEKKKIKIWVVVDEIRDISSKSNKTVAADALIRCATQGRPIGIGMLYTTQNYSDVDKKITNNTSHLFCLTNIKAEARLIGNDFDLTKSQIEDIVNLKKFEIMAVTKTKFILYDSEGNRRESSKPIIGKLLPPLSEPPRPR